MTTNDLFNAANVPFGDTDTHLTPQEAASLSPVMLHAAAGKYFDTLEIHPSWRKILEPVADDINKVGEFLAAEASAGIDVFPPEADRWRAFRQPFEDVKVLIVGQDPYPTPGHAMGLSFSLKPDVRPLAKSLINIFKELESDLGVPRPGNGDLSGWSDQGVMLLNRVLSVRGGAKQAGTHRNKGWEKITDTVIDGLVARNTPMVAILWGKDAQSLAPALAASPSVRIIQSPHPSPLSASRGFFGSKPFSNANRYLTEMGASPVQWQL